MQGKCRKEKKLYNPRCVEVVLWKERGGRVGLSSGGLVRFKMGDLGKGGRMTEVMGIGLMCERENLKNMVQYGPNRITAHVSAKIR